MKQTYVNAVLDFTPVICGKRMRPLTLGHSLILEMIQSPVVNGGPVLFDDAMAFVWVCSQPYADAARAWSDRGRTEKEIVDWGRTAARQGEPCLSWLFGIKRAPQLINMAEVRRLIAEYWLHYSVLPCVDPGAAADRPVETVVEGGAWQFKTALCLMRLGLSEAAAWNMPLPRVMSYLHAL